MAVLFAGVALGCGSVAGPTSPVNTECPTGPFGGAMVRVGSSQGQTYCVDAFEVSVGQYALYLDSNPPSITAMDCVEAPPWFQQFEGLQNAPELPLRGASWCRADAYCRANAKRLCGRVGGGEISNDDESLDPSVGEWFNACSEGGIRTYSYGSAFHPGRCADGGAGVVPSGSLADCEGGFEGLFDMTGNVAEFENGCHYSPSPDEGDSEFYCLIRGESHAADRSGCDARRVASDEGSVAVGVRCCADVKE